MKFLKMVDINLKYLISKQTVIFISISLFIVILAFVFNTNITNNYALRILYYKEYYENYMSSSYNLVSIIYTFFMIFLGILCKRNFDIFLLSRENRVDVIVSKLVSLIILSFMYLMIVFSFFIFIPNVIMPYFVVDSKIILSFLQIMAFGVFVLFLSIMIIELSDTFFSSFCTMVLFWIMKIFTTSDMSKKSLFYVLNYVFPSLIVEEEPKAKVLFINEWVIYLIIALLTTGIITYYHQKDIKK